MKKMLIITGVVFGLIFGFYGAKKLFFSWIMSNYQPPPATISSTTAKLVAWRGSLTSIGTLSAINGVELSAEVPGKVSEIHFNSGQMIKQNDMIVLLDTSVEQADLKSSKAKLKLATISYNRDATLLKKNATSQAVVDKDAAELEEAEANVESIQARIKQKTIAAPFNGYLGIRQINLGQYIQAGTAIVTLQSLDPLYVQFNLPAQDLPNLYIQQPVDITFNSEAQPIRGKITAINSKVDPATRNIQVQATIPNSTFTLRPGMFVDVTIWLRGEKNVIVLPETAIAYSLEGDSVYVIEQDGVDKKNHPQLKVTRRFVKVGERRGDILSILEGLKSGEQVVTSGQLKLQNGSRVTVNNS
ncbi:MAG: efflux RND transporter periplasmic adaptor subunit [Gammaproteobacteria bacterium]|nr:efflux RND transporter periplasmic adaptor subunit [Gammaproteobacteria bacterium]